MSYLLPLKICIPPLLDVVSDLYSTYMLNMDTDVEVGQWSAIVIVFLLLSFVCVWGSDWFDIVLSDLVITTAKYSLWPILQKILIS